MYRTQIILLALILIVICPLSLYGQTDTYYPKGDPDKWNVELTPFLWLPLIHGELRSKRVSEDTDISALELISKLKMAAMITAEVSKGKFFLSTSYVYTKLGTEEVIWDSGPGETSVVAIPDMKMNIFELIAGGRFRINDFLILDPFVGFHYTQYHIYGTIQGIDTTSFDEQTDFWDPVIGFQLHYFPHPRVPIIFKADIGGFGLGSKFSWTTSLISGYTISPSLDLLAGFTAYGTNYETENSTGNTIRTKYDYVWL